MARKAKSRRLISGQDDRGVIDQSAETIVGTFRAHRRGFGFVIPESPSKAGDLFVPPGSTCNAMTGDTVVARLLPRRGRKRRQASDTDRVEAAVVSILERGQSRFVGRLAKQGRRWLVQPDGKVLDDPILVADVGATRARAGDQVVVEITEYPTGERIARGVIVEVLGRSGDPGIDIVSIIHQYHLRDTFPPEVIQEAQATVRRHHRDRSGVSADREDWRDRLIVTIDPADARDFDDAISLRELGPDRYELGVHIADVSAFVQPGGALDEEAAARGNSVYFPRHVLPMLPEVLSNGLCSLQEGQDRLVKSVLIEYDGKGRRLTKRYGNHVIRSSRRLTYRQAAAVLKGQTGDLSPPVVALLRRMETLARRIHKRRLADGMVVLDLPEVELVQNDKDQVTDVVPADVSFPHTIIEMFMVEANEAVAELFANLHVPHLRRIHPDPPPDSEEKLKRFLRCLGRPVPRKLDRETILQLLASVRGKPESYPVNLAVLRSMAQAEYAPTLTGHFALASRHYSHFTSPIRRYPDLMVHRLLQQYLEGTFKTRRGRHEAPSQKRLEQVGRHCSDAERHAEAAENELKRVKILRLLGQRLGDVEKGIVTGVTKIGVFVQLRRYLVEGLARFGNLPDDWWDVDVEKGSVVGRQRGLSIRIGDQFPVQIVQVDIPIRELALAIPESALKSRRGKRAKPGSPKGDRKGTHANRSSGRSRRKRR